MLLLLQVQDTYWFFQGFAPKGPCQLVCALLCYVFVDPLGGLFLHICVCVQVW